MHKDNSYVAASFLCPELVQQRQVKIHLVTSSQCGNAKSCCHLHSELPLNEMFVRDSLGSAQTGEEKHPDIDDQHPNFVHLVHSKKVASFF